MHPEADALLDAIFDNPDDDTPRLVYADWLQESGQTDYAQFIRLSVRAEDGSRPVDERKRLLSERKAFWRRMVAVRHDAYRHVPIGLHNYWRGICTDVMVHGDTFLRTVESWWPAIAPRELTVYATRGFGNLSYETEVVVAVGRFLPWLRELRLLNRPDRGTAFEEVFAPLEGWVFESLAAPRVLPRLQSLRVTLAHVNAPALRAFAASELAERLARLDVDVRFPGTREYDRICVEKKESPDSIRLAIRSFLDWHYGAPVG